MCGFVGKLKHLHGKISVKEVIVVLEDAHYVVNLMRLIFIYFWNATLSVWIRTTCFFLRRWRARVSQVLNIVLDGGWNTVGIFKEQLYLFWEIWKARNGYIFDGVQINSHKITHNILLWLENKRSHTQKIRIFPAGSFPITHNFWLSTLTVRHREAVVAVVFGFGWIIEVTIRSLGLGVQAPIWGLMYWPFGGFFGSLDICLLILCMSMATHMF